MPAAGHLVTASIRTQVLRAQVPFQITVEILVGTNTDKGNYLGLVIYEITDEVQKAMQSNMQFLFDSVDLGES